MVALGLLLVLVSFVYAIPRGGKSGTAALRAIGIGLGKQGDHAMSGDRPQKMNKQQLVRSLMGVLGIIVGGLLVHFGSI